MGLLEMLLWCLAIHPLHWLAWMRTLLLALLLCPCPRVHALHHICARLHLLQFLAVNGISHLGGTIPAGKWRGHDLQEDPAFSTQRNLQHDLNLTVYLSQFVTHLAAWSALTAMTLLEMWVGAVGGSLPPELGHLTGLQVS